MGAQHRQGSQEPQQERKDRAETQAGSLGVPWGQRGLPQPSKMGKVGHEKRGDRAVLREVRRQRRRNKQHININSTLRSGWNESQGVFWMQPRSPQATRELLLSYHFKKPMSSLQFFPSKLKFKGKNFHLQKNTECKMSGFTLLPQLRKFNKVIFCKIMYFY